ncbi:MAG TPA: alpha-(1-_3)-arabinofuranosyltransferase family protein [Acidimicrobiales bacterium]|nr:alpha-(1->3)-arabinofuranosyltransferase family protein [Acidimicrobiales bacterium]
MRNPVPRPTTESARLHLGLAAVAYIPLLLTQRQWVSADTKTYLYLDPSRLLRRAWSMWDPTIGFGTVTHQNIGYLWPMGPFYWVADSLGVPDWAAQRLWWGTLIFAAGSGVAYLLRKLGWSGPALVAATFVYALSPYLLTLVARLSGLLLPYVALPWLVAFTMLTVRTKGWRYPALFALTVATCGSVNATALLLVGLAPALWLAHAVWVADDASFRTAVRAVLRIGVLTVPASLWWIAGLAVQGSNGIEILRYTETAKIVASVSVSHEVLRGLGYWFFYGGDRLGPWIEPSLAYTQFLPLIALTYLIPTLGLAGAVVSRWRHRAYFVLLVAVGTALAVGAYPWDGSATPWAAGVKLFLLSDTGLAMRSLPRAVPLVALGLAVLAGSGVASLVRRWPALRRPAMILAVLIPVLALPPLWTGDFVPENLRRNNVPAYWREAAAHLDEGDHQTRVLVAPGADFASYRWGNTVDPILPGLVDRPSVGRELIPYGSPASANLLNAFDLPLQERTADPDAIAPMARLMRVGDILVQSDLQFERYNTPRPRNFWDFITHAPGLGTPTGFGPGEPNRTIGDVQLEDELLLLTDPGLEDPPELASIPVEDPLDIVTAQPTAAPLLVAGDGAGLVEAAGAGLIDGSELIRYSASLDEDEISGALDDDAALLVTDSNRKRGERWTTVRHTRGYTETADGGTLREDLTDNRLPVFPDAGTDTQTVAVNTGDVTAEATGYGNPITFTAEERPALAVDGDIDTAWRTGAFSDARGERLELSLDDPVTTDHITVTQPTNGSRDRFITEVRLRFDDGDPIDVGLTDQSRDEPGQVIEFGHRTFEKLSIEILSDTVGYTPRYASFGSLGFAEVVIGDGQLAKNEEAVRLPTDLLDAAGTDALGHPLAVALSRQRQDPTDVTRNDDERSMIRLLSLPTARDFRLTGEARLQAGADAPVLDELVGRPHDDETTWVRASSELTGGVGTPADVFDGDETTMWSTARSRPERQWVEVSLPEPVTVDSVPLTVVADGLHSVPTKVEVWADGEIVHEAELPQIDDGDEQNATTTVDVDLPEAVTASQFRFRFTGIREVETNDWVSNSEVAQPAAIAEIGLPGPKVPALDDTFDSGCREDLFRIDDRDVPVRITGPMDDAMAARPLEVRTCGDEAVDLDGGDHELRTASGVRTGVDIDRLVLRSAAGGEASDGGRVLAAEGAGEDDVAAPTLEVVDEGPSHVKVRVEGATDGQPFWLVLGQSYNEGWRASADGDELDAPELVNGYANGWRVVAPGESFEIDMRFAPQRRVDIALWLSAFAVVVCLVLAVRRPKPVAHFPTAMPEPYSPVLAYRYEGALPTRRKAVLTGVGMALLGYLVAGPVVGMAVGVAAGVGTRYETFRRWLLLVSPAALSIAALYVLYIQFRHAPQASYDWPLEMRRVHPLGWVAVVFLVADVVVDRVWLSRRSDDE